MGFNSAFKGLIIYCGVVTTWNNKITKLGKERINVLGGKKQEQRI